MTCGVGEVCQRSARLAQLVVPGVAPTCPRLPGRATGLVGNAPRQAGGRPPGAAPARMPTPGGTHPLSLASAGSPLAARRRSAIVVFLANLVPTNSPRTRHAPANRFRPAITHLYRPDSVAVPGRLQRPGH